MRDFIRSGKAGRCALALAFGLWGAVCFGQETAVKTTPPEEAAKAPEAKPQASKMPEAQPSRSSAAAAEPQTTGNSSSSKKGKASKSESTGGLPVFTGVEDKPYVIGPEDVLYLNVLHQTDVSGNLIVRPDGFVSVRFAGEIKAAGLTAPQLSDEIAEKLTKYFNHPEVNIQVVRIVSKKYYVSGEVRRQGAYALSAPKTVFEAIMEAGGLADFAKKNKIYILRGKERIPFNFSDVSKGKNLQQNIILQNGDVVVVP
jgi:polysaccharide export outer membrane protein